MEYGLLIAVGLVAGVLGGLLGIGGSSIMLPAMVWILGETNDAGVRQINQYMAAAMIVNFLLIIPSVCAHLHNRAIWWKVWKAMAPAAVLGILLGVQISYAFPTDALSWAVGVFFIYVIINNTRRLFGERGGEGLTAEQVAAMPIWRKLVIGFPMGIVAGLLGIGGGSLAVPAQQVGLRMPLRNAIATSAATIMAISWLGAISKNLQIGDHGGSVTRSLLLAACLAPTAMVGAFIGGHLTHKLPLRIVRTAFIGLMAVAAAKMFGWL